MGRRKAIIFLKFLYVNVIEAMLEYFKLGFCEKL